MKLQPRRAAPAPPPGSRLTSGDQSRGRLHSVKNEVLNYTVVRRQTYRHRETQTGRHTEIHSEIHRETGENRELQRDIDNTYANRQTKIKIERYR